MLTATRRLSEQWQCVLAQKAPFMMSENDFLMILWTHVEACGLTAARLLTDTQAQILWTNLIAQSSAGQRLLKLSATAKNISNAYGLLKQWKLSLSDVQAIERLNEENQCFLAWALEFEALLRRENWFISSELPDRLMPLIPALDPILRSYSPEKKLDLLGFEAINPQMQAFYQALREQGWQIAEIHGSAQTHQARHYEFSSQESELSAAAQWARSKAKDQYSGAIGIVVPDLEKCRALVEKIFLTDEFALSIAPSVSAQVNISVAPALRSYPMIAVVLQALLLLKEDTISLSDFIDLSHSPFLILAKDWCASAADCYALKKKEKANIVVDSLDLSSINLRSAYGKKLPVKQSIGAWIDCIDNFLDQLHWPGVRALTSIEHQVFARWQLFLLEVRELSVVLGPQSIQEVYYLITSLLSELPFQAKTQGAPIHVMGLLEASDQPFEYLWVSGLHNEAWPPIPKPNPFLPLSLQRALNMPHASVKREYDFSEQLTQHLKHACEGVIFSFFTTDQVKHYEASAFITDLPKAVFTHTHPPALTLPGLEKLIDTQGPAIQPNEAYGGVDLMRSQALCPFKAFVQYRLHTPAIYPPIWGLSEKKRGQLVHDILEKIWEPLKTQEALMRLSESDLKVLIDHVIGSAIGVLKRDETLPAFYWEVEAWRLQYIVLSSLVLEKQRLPFNVAAKEWVLKVTVGDLCLPLRIDRVDKIIDQDQWVIIDYKTGSLPSLSACLETRPIEPQLLLYALNTQYPPQAVIFSQITAQGSAFKGFSRDPDLLPGVKPLENWDGLVAQWRESLTTIATEFSEGVATVSPYEGTKSCRYCHLRPVCRFQPESLEEEYE